VDVDVVLVAKAIHATAMIPAHANVIANHALVCYSLNMIFV
jgi:hypothetical protein